MGLVAPEEGWTWVSVPTHEAIEVVVVGDIETWWTHWHRGPGERFASAVRCTAKEAAACEWCRGGYERRARYVMPVEHDGQVRALELGRVQYPALASIVEFGGVLGARLRLVRERPVKNAPIRLTLVGRADVPEHRVRDVGPFVASLGLVQLRLLDAPVPPSNGRRDGDLDSLGDRHARRRV